MAQERAPKSPEKEHVQHESAKSQEKLRETIEAGKQAKHEAKDSLDEIRSSIEREAVSAKQKKNEQEADAQQDQGPGHVIIDRTVKGKAYKKELHRIQSHLPKSRRSLSKFIHTPAVEAISEVGGKTVARPSGLLGGGVVAFLGTGALVWTSRHYGFTYNYFVFIALLVAGFFVGLILELIIRTLLKARH